jgi:phage terminase large subunit
MIEVVEGSTYENKDNVPEDFIETLEMTYTEQMKDRFLKGEWAGYEGLVYPNFDINRNVLPHDWVKEYYFSLREQYKIEIIEGFDYGLAVPSCYMLGFVDPWGNILILDGYYEKERPPSYIAEQILKIRSNYGIYDTNILADPAIFKRTIVQNNQTLSLADIMFQDYNIRMIPAQNDILSGIAKITGYFNISKMHQNPMTKNYNAPYFYISDKNEYFITEIGNYYWTKDAKDNYKDMPQDKDDHAMDTLKYMLTYRPNVSTLIQARAKTSTIPTKWTELEDDYDE